jgi:hypothetical protein
MDLVHRYGRACGEQDHCRAGVLYSEIVRAIQDDEEAPPSGEGGAVDVLLRYEGLVSADQVAGGTAFREM